MTTGVDSVGVKLPSSGVGELLTVKDLPGCAKMKQVTPVPPRPNGELVVPIWAPGPDLLPGRPRSRFRPLIEKPLLMDRMRVPYGLDRQHQPAMYPTFDNVVGYRSGRHQEMDTSAVPGPLLYPSRMDSSIDNLPLHLLHLSRTPAQEDGSQTSRTPSSERHRVLEKRRRDFMGAIIQAADILGKDFDPARIIGCAICKEDDNRSSNSISTSIFAGICGLAMPAAKHTKNDMVFEDLYWKFSIMMHLYPAEMPKKLDDLHVGASQLAKENEHRRRKGSAKKDDITRADFFQALLRMMETKCKTHGIYHRGDDASSGFAQGSTITPPRSVSAPSPTIGQKRPREVSEESQYDVEPRKISWSSFSRL